MRENGELRDQLQEVQLQVMLCALAVDNSQMLTARQLKSPTEELVTQSTYYKILLERTSRLEHVSQESQTEATKLREQLDALSASRSEFEVDMKVDTSLDILESLVAHVLAQASQDATISELKQMLTKRDAESARLRELRDQFQSEINERKMKEQTRLASVLEFKALAENRAVCTVTLQ